MRTTHETALQALISLGIKPDAAEAAAKAAEKAETRKAAAAVPTPEQIIQALEALGLSHDAAVAASRASAPRTMSAQLKSAKVDYVKTARPQGTASADNGDRIARALRPLQPNEVAALADKVCETETGYHLNRYQERNQGQVRMNSGNRIRNAYRNATSRGDMAELARIEGLLGLKPQLG